MSHFRYVLGGREVGENVLFKRFGDEHGRRLMEAPFEEMSLLRRRMIADGKKRNPNFILSEEAYRECGAGDWTVTIEENGDYLTTRELR